MGLNIVLPFEQSPNEYVTPHLCFNFHYFALRKMHFMMRAKALVVFPGGFGTLDELFEVLCLIQTRKIKPIPVLLVRAEYWRRIIDFEAMVDEGVIARGRPGHLHLRRIGRRGVADTGARAQTNGGQYEVHRARPKAARLLMLCLFTAI